MKPQYFYLTAVVLIFALVAGWMGLFEHLAKPETVHAQGNFCNQTIAISIAAANTQTILAGYGTDPIYVCGFVISGDTLATTGIFKSGSISLTGAMRMPDEGSIVAGNFYDSQLFQTPGGGNLTITAATGAITGFIRVGQH